MYVHIFLPVGSRNIRIGKLNYITINDAKILIVNFPYILCDINSLLSTDKVIIHKSRGYQVF